MTDVTKTLWPATPTDRIEKDYFVYSLHKRNIHLVKIKPIDPTEKAFNEYVDFTGYSSTNMQGALIVDISDGKFLTSEQRIKLSKSIKDYTDTIRKNWTSIAYVNTSIVASIILKGILLASPLPVKSKVFTSLEDAVSWSEKNF